VLEDVMEGTQWASTLGLLDKKKLREINDTARRDSKGALRRDPP
jgi:hypothetical protein